VRVTTQPAAHLDGSHLVLARLIVNLLTVSACVDASAASYFQNGRTATAAIDHDDDAREAAADPGDGGGRGRRRGAGPQVAQRGPPATTAVNTPCIRPRISSGA